MINIFLILVLIYVNKTIQFKLNYDIIYELASMSHNMYLNIGDKRWINTTLDNVKDLSNGTVRAYLFSNNNLTKNVLAIKGTSVYFGSFMEIKEVNTKTYFLNETFIGNEIPFETMSSVSNDKWNDNLFFSCCFEKVGIKECECKSKDVCCKDCYKQSLEFEKNYLGIMDKIMDMVKDIIDIENDNIELMFTGHSLGGMLASYLGIKYQRLTVAFESPGDKHYFELTGLINMETNYDNIYHFGHNADPIFMGDCGSTCSVLGYHIDTKCHIGNTCLYDAKEQLNYTESIWNHRVDFIVNNIISHWNETLPECKSDTQCTECESKLLY